MIRLMISALVIAIILLIFGAKGAAHDVLNWTLTIVKWIFIVGSIIFVGALIFSKKR